MLPKSERLSKKDFLGLKTGTIFRGTYVDIAVSPSKTLKFSCIISKKRIKTAVDRNKTRRKIYAMLQDIKTKHPQFILIYPKHTAVSSSYKNIEKEISTAFDTL